MITVKNRELHIPREEFNIGTTYDENSMVRLFQITRVNSGGVDIAGLNFKLDLKYANGGYNTVSLVKEISDKYINLTWLITNSQLQVPGSVVIQIRALDNDGKCKWTSYYGVVFVEDSINTPGHYSGDLTELEQFETEIAEVGAKTQANLHDVAKLKPDVAKLQTDLAALDGKALKYIRHLSSSEDFNDITEMGMYGMGGSGTLQGHSPEGAPLGWGILIVLTAPYVSYQLLTKWNNGNILQWERRLYNNETWSDWRFRPNPTTIDEIYSKIQQNRNVSTDYHNYINQNLLKVNNERYMSLEKAGAYWYQFNLVAGHTYVIENLGSSGAATMYACDEYNGERLYTLSTNLLAGNKKEYVATTSTTWLNGYINIDNGRLHIYDKDNSWEQWFIEPVTQSVKEINQKITEERKFTIQYANQKSEDLKYYAEQTGLHIGTDAPTNGVKFWIDTTDDSERLLTGIHLEYYGGDLPSGTYPAKSDYGVFKVYDDGYTESYTGRVNEFTMELLGKLHFSVTATINGRSYSSNEVIIKMI